MGAHQPARGVRLLRSKAPGFGRHSTSKNRREIESSNEGTKTHVNGGFQRFLSRAMSLYVPLSKGTQDAVFDGQPSRGVTQGKAAGEAPFPPARCRSGNAGHVVKLIHPLPDL